MREELNGILTRHSGRTLEEIKADTERDHFLSAEEAKDYGLIDEVLERLPSVGVPTR